jgi:hypothetical protein
MDTLHTVEQYVAAVVAILRSQNASSQAIMLPAEVVDFIAAVVT